VPLVISRDYFASRTLLRRCGNAFRVMSDGRVRASQRGVRSHGWPLRHAGLQIFLGVAGNCDGPGSSTDGWAVTLEVSRNSGAAWSTACFPSFEAEHGYTLYDMGGDAFVHVDHSDTRDPVKAGQPLGVLYHADADGKLFSLSRRDVLLQPTGVSDFMPAGGLSGVALANSVDPAVWTDPAFLTGSTTVYSAVLSSVSRDAGSNWAPLPTPAPLAGQPPCGGDVAACALHVHGPDAAWRANVSYPGLYASSGTPGVSRRSGLSHPTSPHTLPASGPPVQAQAGMAVAEPVAATQEPTPAQAPAAGSGAGQGSAAEQLAARLYDSGSRDGPLVPVFHTDTYSGPAPSGVLHRPRHCCVQYDADELLALYSGHSAPLHSSGTAGDAPAHWRRSSTTRL
jgi:hypothetical protein